MRTKLLTLFSALLLSAQMFAYDFKVDGIYYDFLDGDSVKVVCECANSYFWAEYNDYAGDIVIPATVDYNNKTYRVTAIGENALRVKSGLYSVTIPSSITEIGDSALWANSLTSVVWNATSCTNYSWDAILPPSVTSVTIGENVKYIPDALCKELKDLTFVTIPDNVEMIGSWAFASSGLRNIAIPDNVDSIGEYICANCTNLQSVILGNGLSTIPQRAFDKCTSLSDVEFSNEITRIEDHAFLGTKLSSVQLPQKLEYLGWQAFSHTNLSDVVIPDSVTYIDTYCFSDSPLESVTIGEKVQYLEYSVFSGTNLQSIIWNAKKGSWWLQDDNIENSITSVTFGDKVEYIPSSFAHCKNLISIVIPESVTEMENGAFGNTGLTSVIWNAKRCKHLGYSVFPSSVTSFTFGEKVEIIPAWLCYGLDISSISIPNSTTLIGESAFETCRSLTSLAIPDNVTAIGNDAFRSCRSIESISLGKSVSTIGERAFYFNEALSQINVDEANESFLGKGNCLIDKRTKTLLLGCKSSVIPTDGSVSNIGFGAFFGTQIAAVHIPSSVTKVEEEVFAGCENLTSITADENIFIAKNNCLIHKDTKTMVAGCKTSIIPNDGSVTKIGPWACFAIPFEILTIPGCVDSIQEAAFYGCAKLKSLVIEDGVKYIGESSFCQCISMKSAEIGEGVKYIDYVAFGASLALETLTLPSSLDSIGYAAFSGCEETIKTIIYKAAKPVALDYESNFWDMPYDACTLVVPCGTTETYRATEGWKLFTNIEENTMLDFSVISSDESKGLVVILQEPTCEQDAIIQAVPKSGYEFVSWNDGNTENPRIVTVTEDVQYVATFAEGDTEVVTDVKVEPSDTAAAFTWPAVEGANSYVLVIWANAEQTEKICTLTFNAAGSLTGIDFSRNKPASSRTANAGGLNFTVTGLEAGTTYLYSLSSYDSEGTQIDSNTGTFTTTGDETSALENISVSGSSIHKVLENGTIYILRNGEKYTVDGIRVM